jgi:signal transduction histidine kinase
MRFRTIAAVAITLLAGATLASAATKDDAVAMVKKAVALIKADGPDKAYAEFNKGGQFVDGELYVVVQRFDGTVLAQAANNKLVGKNLIDAQDVDGKYFSKGLVENGRNNASFWYDFKFVNPATKKIQMKDMYCESLGETVVCTGVYRP